MCFVISSVLSRQYSWHSTARFLDCAHINCAHIFSGLSSQVKYMKVKILLAFALFSLTAYAADDNTRTRSWPSPRTHVRIAYTLATALGFYTTYILAINPQCTGFDFACNPEGQCLPGGNMITNGTDTIIFPYEE